VKTRVTKIETSVAQLRKLRCEKESSWKPTRAASPAKPKERTRPAMVAIEASAQRTKTPKTTWWNQPCSVQPL
jgi:hypothetical protein